MPHPHEQKLHDVVNSLTLESFRFCVLARTAGRSTKLASASPAQPPALFFSHSLRESCDALEGDSASSFRTSPRLEIISLSKAMMFQPLGGVRLNSLVKLGSKRLSCHWKF